MTLPRRLFCLLGLWLPLALAAQEQGGAIQPRQFVADIELQTESELQALLQRAEQLLLSGQATQVSGPAVSFVLHGPVLRSLLRENYGDSKALVDKAASLTALGVVEMKACRIWLSKNGLDETQLQPFVHGVDYGVDEVERLVRDQGYYFF